MQNKVLLILVDGMRSDGVFTQKDNFMVKLAENSAYTWEAKSIIPTITLPCHFTLFDSVPPERHGMFGNTYIPLVRPIDSIFDVCFKAGKLTGSFYNWAELKYLASPRSVNRAEFYDMDKIPDTDIFLAQHAKEYIKNYSPDFVFLYLGQTDDSGHKFGYTSDEYLKTIHNANDYIKDVVESLSDEYSVIITADHGGHERCHGSTCKEDMTIPLIIHSKKVKPQIIKNVSLIDIAPTITALMDIKPAQEWEGRNLLLELI